MDRLKTDMLIEQEKVKYYQAVLERTQEELDSMRVLWLFPCLQRTSVFSYTKNEMITFGINQNLVLFTYHFEAFTSIYVSLRDNEIMFMSSVK